MKKPPAALVGLGMTSFQRHYQASTQEMAVQAIHLAINDAGMKTGDIDGLLVVRSPVAFANDISIELQASAGLDHMNFVLTPEAEGASFLIALQLATMAIAAGQARNVVCVFADAPIRPAHSSGAAFADPISISLMPGWEERQGLLAAAGPFALLAQRYMALYGATPEQLGQIAVANRRWAHLDERAMKRELITVADYLASDYVIEPLRILDCAYPVNGAIAVVISDADRAADCPNSPAYVHGYSQAHNGSLMHRHETPPLKTGAYEAGQRAYAMAGITAADVSQRQFYEAFSVVQWLALEDYGFCGRGEAAALIAAGATSPGGRLPTNTNGGHLSGSYLQGATPLAEAVLQIRGKAGERQVNADIVLTTGIGGWLAHHACMVLSPHKTLQA